MAKNKKENYLDKIPYIPDSQKWEKTDDGKIVLIVFNKGIFNLLAQKIFKKPETTKIHLDEMGSFVWQIIDGSRSIFELGADVKGHFGDKSEPLYERLAQYFRMLSDYGFIRWK